MKNLNTKKVKFLIETFSELNDEFQDIAIGRVSELLYDQKAKSEVIGTAAENPDDKVLKDKISKHSKTMKHDAVKFINQFTQLDHEQMAQLIITMERLIPGTFTKKEEITVSIVSKPISLKEFFEINLPDVDYETARINEEKLYLEISNNN